MPVFSPFPCWCSIAQTTLHPLTHWVDPLNAAPDFGVCPISSIAHPSLGCKPVQRVMECRHLGPVVFVASEGSADVVYGPASWHLRSDEKAVGLGHRKPCHQSTDPPIPLAAGPEAAHRLRLFCSRVWHSNVDAILRPRPRMSHKPCDLLHRSLSPTQFHQGSPYRSRRRSRVEVPGGSFPYHLLLPEERVLLQAATGRQANCVALSHRGGLRRAVVAVPRSD